MCLIIGSVYSDGLTSASAISTSAMSSVCFSFFSLFSSLSFAIVCDEGFSIEVGNL